MWRFWWLLVFITKLKDFNWTYMFITWFYGSFMIKLGSVSVYLIFFYCSIRIKRIAYSSGSCSVFSFWKENCTSWSWPPLKTFYFEIRKLELLFCVRGHAGNTGCWLAETYCPIERHEQTRKLLLPIPEPYFSESWAEFRDRDGARRLLEAAVLVLLPVPPGDRALHAGALGEDGVQYPFSSGSETGPAVLVIS